MELAVDIYRYLSEHGIDYERHDHPPVFTCEEADRLVPELPAAKTKNLFLRDKKGRRHLLVVVGYEKAVDLKALSSILGISGLSLASPERLKKYLGVDPGRLRFWGSYMTQARKLVLLLMRAYGALRPFDAIPW